MTERTDRIKEFVDSIRGRKPIDFDAYHGWLGKAFEFPAALGYAEENVYVQATYNINGNRILTDIAVADDQDARPWLIVDCETYESAAEFRAAPEGVENSLYIYRAALDAEYGVLLSNHGIKISASGVGTDVEISFDDLSESDLESIATTLEPPTELPTTRAVANDEFSDENISKENFELNMVEFSNLYNAVTSDESGDAMEELAKTLLSGLQHLTIRSHNDSNSALGEIDLLAEHEVRADPSLFDYYNRFIPVECKDWGSAVGISQVNHFARKVDSSNSDLGIIFASNGVSGKERRNYSQLALRDVFVDNSIVIIVIDSDDIERIGQSGESLYEIIDEKIFQTKFPRITRNSSDDSIPDREEFSTESEWIEALSDALSVSQKEVESLVTGQDN